MRKIHIKAPGRNDSLCHQHSDTKLLVENPTRSDVMQAKVCTNCRKAWVKNNET